MDTVAIVGQSVANASTPQPKKQKLKVSEVRKIQQLEKIIKTAPTVKKLVPRVKINVDEHRKVSNSYRCNLNDIRLNGAEN